MNQSRITQLNTDRLSKLFPALAEKGKQFLADCFEQGVVVLVTQGLRSFEYQKALFAQGRLPLAQVNELMLAAGQGKITAKENIVVTKARPGQSYHNFGLAFDIVPIDKSGAAIWNTNDPAWIVCLKIGKLHTGSIDSRLDPAFIAKVVAQDLQLKEGADFKSIKDIPHFEMTRGVTLETLCALYKPNDLSLCWQKVEHSL